jgi:hypothetical protein
MLAAHIACFCIAVAFLLPGKLEAAEASPLLVQDNKPYESVTESSKLYQDREAHTIHGVVQDVKTVTLENDDRFVQLRLKTDDELVHVHLGPEWFMTEQINRVEIKKGHKLEVTGSGNVVAGTPVFVASEIRDEQRNGRLRLRHRDGTPVWAGSERVH